MNRPLNANTNTNEQVRQYPYGYYTDTTEFIENDTEYRCCVEVTPAVEGADMKPVLPAS